MSLDEPTMLGASPEERMQAEKKRKRLTKVAAVFIIILVVGIAILLLPPPASKNVYVVSVGSHCGGEGGTASYGSLSCVVILAAKTGTITPATVKSVLINGTVPSAPATTVKQSGSDLMVSAGVTLISMKDGLPDVGPSVLPPTVGSVVVYLNDGTAVSVLLGAGGIVTPGTPTSGGGGTNGYGNG